LSKLITTLENGVVKVDYNIGDGVKVDHNIGEWCQS